MIEDSLSVDIGNGMCVECKVLDKHLSPKLSLSLLRNSQYIIKDNNLKLFEFLKSFTNNVVKAINKYYNFPMLYDLFEITDVINGNLAYKIDTKENKLYFLISESRVLRFNMRDYNDVIMYIPNKNFIICDRLTILKEIPDLINYRNLVTELCGDYNYYEISKGDSNLKINVRVNNKDTDDIKIYCNEGLTIDEIIAVLHQVNTERVNCQGKSRIQIGNIRKKINEFYSTKQFTEKQKHQEKIKSVFTLNDYEKLIVETNIN